MDGGHARVTTLPDDLCREIDLIMGRTNAGTELNDEIGRTRTKLRRHRLDRVRHDTQLRAFLSRMNQPDGAPDRIGDVNGATISDVDPETNAALVRDDSIAVLETMIGHGCRPDGGNLFPVDLLRRHEGHPADPMTASDFPVNAVQPRERFRLVVRHLEAGHAQGKAVRQIGHSVQRGKMLGRERNAGHFGLVVVRVVVVVVLVVTGGRLPA